MTRADLKSLEATLNYQNRGLVLSYIARAMLDNVSLTLMQTLTLDGIDNAEGYIPQDFETLYKSVLEVMELLVANKVDAVITVIKRLPTPSNATKEVEYYLDGGRIDQNTFFDSHKYKGVRTCKRPTPTSKKPYSSMDKKEFEKTSFAQTRGGDIVGRKLFGASFAPDPTANKVDFEYEEPMEDEPKERAEEPKEPCKDPKPVDTKEDDSLLGDDEPSSKWINRGDTDE